MSEERKMKAFNLNKELFGRASRKTDPAYRQITEGLEKELSKLLQDPERLSISCCIEGCCVSWCCVQIS